MRALDPADMIGVAAARHGDRIALVCRGRTLTYAALDATAGQVAAGLTGQGIRPGERVTLFSENRWEWVAAYHGILRAGCVVNPVNAMLTAPELAAIVEDCGSAALLASGPCTERINSTLPDGVRLRVSFDDSPTAVVRFTELLGDGPAGWDSASARPRDLCGISYTSGTTGRPKGAMQAREALLLNWAYTAAMHGRSAADVVLTALPLPHVYGNCAVNSALLAGATVVLEPRFDATRMLGLVAEHGVTMIEGVPAMYAMLLDALATTVADFTTLTRCTVGGQTISDAVVDAWEKATGAPLLELWGMTELSGLATTHAAYAPSARGSIGVAFPGTEVRVASLDQVTADAPEGEDGELMVRGPLVTLGYYGNEAATRETIEPDGWLHTGDIAHRHGAHFYIVDRLKDMILTGGYNIYPAEIERVLAGHPDVALVGVGRVSDPRLGEVAHAYVVPAQGQSPDPDAILAFARTQLAPYKIPKAVHVVAALPTTSSGKIRRRDLAPPPGPPGTLMT
ncbi:class I adenylate-forming enzyme family protein [Streptomyces prunicolor]|uniref:AMP-binding protein n=1 Tax=Streptomyces prunicolor TaxID=67348 RepID=A0ABU4F935_9ACTN|nr:AMP-binding protein [Streptomyces prunicolor]MDV7217108.1 AMP-binding protein [Streptomyces prunicolor]